MTEFTRPAKSCCPRTDIRQNIASTCICIALSAFGLPATAGPEEDLGVMFRGDASLPPPCGIAGTVTNKSALHYDCVDLVFRLSYKSGESDDPAEQRVRVENLSPRSVTNYSAPLQKKAGFGLQGIETCSSIPGGIPPTQSADRDCTVTGQVTSTTGFEGIGDTGQSEIIGRVFLLTPDAKLVSEEPLSDSTKRVRDHRTGQTYDSRDFSFARLPENLSYVVRLSNAWKSNPTTLTFQCPDPQGHYEFSIGTLQHTGNRLGG